MTDGNSIMQVKGKALASIPKFVHKRFGKEGFERWLDAISVEAHELYLFPVDTDKWYPLKSCMIEPCANIAQLFFNWEMKEAAWEMGRFAADYSLNQVMKFFTKMTPATFLAKKACDLFNENYRPVNVELVDMELNSGIIRVTLFPEMDKSVEYRFAGRIERTLEIHGGKNIKVEIPRSLTNFQAVTEFLVKWE